MSLQSVRIRNGGISGRRQWPPLSKRTNRLDMGHAIHYGCSVKCLPLAQLYLNSCSPAGSLVLGDYGTFKRSGLDHWGGPDRTAVLLLGQLDVKNTLYIGHALSTADPSRGAFLEVTDCTMKPWASSTPLSCSVSCFTGGKKSKRIYLQSVRVCEGSWPWVSRTAEPALC